MSARKSDVNNIGVCENRTLHSKRSIKVNEDNDGQYTTNATICILLLPKYDEDNDVRDCLNYSIQA